MLHFASEMKKKYVLNNSIYIFFSSQNLKTRMDRIRMEKAKSGKTATLILPTRALVSRKMDVERFVRPDGQLVGRHLAWEVQ